MRKILLKVIVYCCVLLKFGACVSVAASDSFTLVSQAIDNETQGHEIAFSPDTKTIAVNHSGWAGHARGISLWSIHGYFIRRITP